jgi:hypothetical protein
LSPQFWDITKILSDFNFKAEFMTTGRFSGKPGTETVAASHGEAIRTMRRLAFPGLALLPGAIAHFLPPPPVSDFPD